MEISLTKGVLSEILRGIKVEKPIVKIMEIVKVTFHNGEPDRYRLCISDGVTTYAAVMLSIGLHPLILNKTIDKFSVIQILEYKTNLYPIGGQSRLMIFLLQINVLNCTSQIGRVFIANSHETDNKINNNSHPIIITSVRDQLLEINQWKGRINECKSQIHHLKIVYDAEKNKTTMHQKQQQQQQIDAEIQLLVQTFTREKMKENNLINEMNQLRTEKSVLEEKLIDAEEVAGIRMPRHFYDVLEEEINENNTTTDGPSHLW